MKALSSEYMEIPLGGSDVAPSAPPLDDRIENNETCRICEEAVNSNYFIRPCLCARRCHRHCLDKSRSLSVQAMTHCPACHFQYEMEFVADDETCTPMCQFKWIVARNIFLVTLLSQVLTCFLGFVIIPILDAPANSRLHWFSPSWSVVTVNYVSGLFIVFAILGVVVLVKGLLLICAGSSSGRRRYSSYQDNSVHIWFFPSSGGGSSGCNDSGSSSKQDKPDAAAALLVCFIVAFAIVGLIYACFVFVAWASKVYYEHYKISERYYIARKRRIKDLENDDQDHANLASIHMV